jgi:hypothetical protein
MMSLRRGPNPVVFDDPEYRPKGNVARAIRAYCAGSGRGGITNDAGNLAVTVHLDCAISLRLP